MAEPADLPLQDLQDQRYLRLARAFIRFLLPFERDSLEYVRQLQDEGFLNDEEVVFLRFHLLQALERRRGPSGER